MMSPSHDNSTRKPAWIRHAQVCARLHQWNAVLWLSYMAWYRDAGETDRLSRVHGLFESDTYREWWMANKGDRYTGPHKRVKAEVRRELNLEEVRDGDEREG